MGTDNTHWRTGSGGKTWSSRWAAVWAMRRALHDGHTPRPLQEKATRKSCPACLILAAEIHHAMHAETLLSAAELTVRWRELLIDPESPDFFELNEYGELILSPSPTNRHELIAFRVATALEQQLGPHASTAVSVLTGSRGVRRPDASWMPAENWRSAQYADPLPFAPDICVEVLSKKNTRAEISMKTAAYLSSGAQEVVVVGTGGEVQYFGAEGKRETSAFGLHMSLPPELFR